MAGQQVNMFKFNDDCSDGAKSKVGLWTISQKYVHMYVCNKNNR